jgi:hypothetical protein
MTAIISDAEPNRKEAVRCFSTFVKCKKELIDTAIATDEKQIGAGEVLEISIEAPMVEIGENSFAPAIIKVEKINVFRKIYLTMLKILDKADYKEIPFNQTVCGLAIIITFKIITLK